MSFLVTVCFVALFSLVTVLATFQKNWAIFTMFLVTLSVTKKKEVFITLTLEKTLDLAHHILQSNIYNEDPANDDEQSRLKCL